jgi:hypothetical protein
MVDQDGYGLFPAPEHKMFAEMADVFGGIGDTLRALTTDEHAVGGDMDSLYSHLDKVDPDKPFGALQAQLCPSTINCCVLGTMKWYSVSISNLHEVSFSHQGHVSIYRTTFGVMRTRALLVSAGDMIE